MSPRERRGRLSPRPDCETNYPPIAKCDSQLLRKVRRDHDYRARRWTAPAAAQLAILTTGLGLAMAVIDGAIANVALPTTAESLDASPTFSIWIVNGCQFAITISLLPPASLGEIFGYRRVDLAGLLLFTLASLSSAGARGAERAQVYDDQRLRGE